MFLQVKEVQPPKNWAKKIQEEWKILDKDLPDTIFVRVYESRMDLLRAVIIEAEGSRTETNIVAIHSSPPPLRFCCPFGFLGHFPLLVVGDDGYGGGQYDWHEMATHVLNGRCKSTIPHHVALLLYDTWLGDSPLNIKYPRLKKEIGRAKEYIVKQLELEMSQSVEIGTIHAGDFMRRLCSNLGMTNQTVKAAQESVQKSEEFDI
ncbi:hypothetical protein M8C21_021124, partial [Ambrosia artemisiifolia]